MKRIALVALVVSLASSVGCSSLTKGGARGPTIARTVDAPQPAPQAGSLDGRPELGQR